MGWLAFQEEVRHALRDKPHLRPVFHSTLDIPRRLYEYDSRLFIVMNRDPDSKRLYEVHSLGQTAPDTFAMASRFRSLDARLLRDVARQDVRRHGRALLRALEAEQDAAERRREREIENWADDVAHEARPLFARNYWDPAGYGSRVTFGWQGEGKACTAG